MEAVNQQDIKNEQDVKEVKDNFKVFVDGDGIMNIIFLKNAKEGLAHFQTLMAELISNEIFEIYRRNPGKIFKALIDLVALENLSALSGRAKKLYASAAAHPQAGKIAVIGRFLFYKVIFIIIARISGKEVEWFEDKEEALKWLKEN